MTKWRDIPSSDFLFQSRVYRLTLLHFCAKHFYMK